jgi:hypothetical protein
MGRDVLDSKGGREGGLESSIVRDIPFEFIGKVASAGAVAEAGNVESGSTARHVGLSCQRYNTMIVGDLKRR